MAILGLNEEEYFMCGHRACTGCGQALGLRHTIKAAGKNTIIAMATGCGEVFSTPYPYTAWKVPWIHVAFENVAAVASGIDAALRKLGKKNINILAIAGDGGTYDIGFQALSGMVERGHKVCFVCMQNGGYQNTGNQRSGSTNKYEDTTTSPYGKKIHGKMEWPKPMPFIITAHNNKVYVATASVAFPQDLAKKVQKGLAHNGPSYIEVDVPCPLGWRHNSSMSIEVAKKAFETNFFPLFEIEDGMLKFSKKPSEPKPVEEYLKLQGRFKNMTKEEIADVQKYVDERWEKLNKMEEGKIRL